MPIRLNLLAETHAAQEERRRDPVKRLAWVAALFVVAMLVWSGSLQFKSMLINGEVSGLEAQISTRSNEYRVVLDNQNKTADLKHKLAALRRLRFPIGGVTTPEIDGAARSVLAALGLAAICFLDEDGYDLRSRCLLDGKPGTFEFVGRGETSPFSLDAKGAAQLLTAAAEAAKRVGLPWSEKPITLQPSPDLSRLVVESRRRSMAASAGE